MIGARMKRIIIQGILIVGLLGARTPES